MGTKRVLSYACVAGAIALLAAIGCKERIGPRGERIAGKAPQRGGTLHLATLSDLRSLDPAVAFDTESQPFLELMFAGLVDYDPQGNLVGDLAERWEVSPDGLRYRFFLRHGVRMHDGSELTADDVKRTAERTFHKDTPCPVRTFFERIEGLADYQDGKVDHLSGVEVESDHVVSFKLTKPDATFLSVLALDALRPVCKSGGARYDDEFQKHPCGAGPFKIGAWEPGRSLRIERFDGYFVPGLPYLDAIEETMDVPRLTQRFELEAGNLDFMWELERPDWIYYRTHQDWKKFGTERIESAVYGEFMNVQMEPFTDKRVRQAVASVIDRPHLKLYMEGGSKVTGHLIPPGIPGYVEDPPWAQQFDLERARRLMAEAGYAFDPATGKGGYSEPIEYIAGEGESAIRWAQLLQYDLSQIGIRLDIKITSFAQYLALTGRPKTVKMAFTGWNLDYPDPSDFFEPILTTQSIAEEESQNHAFYSNPRLDALVYAAHGELDPEKRLAMYHEAESIVCDEAPWAFAYYPVRFELTQPWVHDYKPHAVWQEFFKYTWIDESQRPSTTTMRRPFTTRDRDAFGALLAPILRGAK